MADQREDFVNALVDLDETTCIELLKGRIAAKEDPLQILEDIRKATDIVGKRFEEGRYFVSDLMMAGEILSQAMALLKPVFGEHKMASRDHPCRDGRRGRARHREKYRLRTP